MKHRKPSALTPLSPNKIDDPIRKCVFDIETIAWTQPYSCGFYDGENMTTYDGRECIGDFLNVFLTHRYRGWTAYAHNGGKFDFNFILQYLIENNYKKKYVIHPMRAGARIIQLKISTRRKRVRKGKQITEIMHTWTLTDSFSMLPFALKRLTDNFDVESKKGDFDHKKINWRNWSKLMPEWKPYLINDCKGLYQVMEKFENYMITKFNTSLKDTVTIAQMSLRVYRKKYLKNAIPTYESIEDDIRQAYYGGRTEIFRMYGENLRYYDVNSEYPDAMRNKKMPVGTPIKSFRMTIDDFGIAYCEISCPKTIKYPLLPYRAPSGKLLFPVGTWKGWYCTPELHKAWDMGYDIKINYGYKFQSANLFREYIDDMYDIKQNSEKDSVPYHSAKSLMNNLYGKFGQKRDRENIVMFPDDIKGMTPIDFFGDLPVYTEKVRSKSKHILPAVAAFVTCYARLKIYGYIEQALAKGGHIYYMDTDSLITDVELNVSTRLGDLKLEIPKIKRGVFLLPKMYGMETSEGEYIKCKGFPMYKDSTDKNGKKIRLFTFDIFKKALDTDDYSAFKYKTRKIATPFESMRRNKTFVSMINFSRRVLNKYDKRTVIDGFDTDPIGIDGDAILKVITEKKEQDKKILNKRDESIVADRIKSSQRKLIKSDKFDKHSVGKDISADEFIENEKFWVMKE